MNNYAHSVISNFENEIAKFTNSKCCICVDSCTSAIFLSCYYFFNILGESKEATIPNCTFFSVPASIIHAGGKVGFIDEEWAGVYQLKPHPIFDSACRFTKDMYTPGTFMCLSFDIKKHLPIGRGGAILCDDEKAANWFRKARFNGRDVGPRMKCMPDFVGWKCYMHADDACRGLELLSVMNHENHDLSFEYPNLSTLKIYK